MLKRLVILLALCIPQLGCDAEYGENIYPYKIRDLEEVRGRLEREKREFIQIEDLEVGGGPVAAWGRRIKADVEIRYKDGTVVHKGPLLTYYGFHLELTTGDRLLGEPYLLSNN